MDDHVKVRVRFRPAIGLLGEAPWARPLDANEGGGTFALLNDLFHTYLRHGDVVRCEIDPNGILQVVGIEELRPGYEAVAEHPPDLTDADVRFAMLMLESLGWEVSRPAEGHVRLRCELDERGMPLVTGGARIPAGWRCLESVPQDARREWIEEDVDFELDTQVLSPPGPIAYWAPEDPTWARLGVTDPATLARIQSLATSDPRIVPTLEAGRHRDVLTLIERISVPDPRLLPKLDRPLLVNPDE